MLQCRNPHKVLRTTYHPKWKIVLKCRRPLHDMVDVLPSFRLSRVRLKLFKVLRTVEIVCLDVSIVIPHPQRRIEGVENPSDRRALDCRAKEPPRHLLNDSGS